MFKDLTDFAIQRTARQAFGFWLAYLVLGMLGLALLGSLIGSYVRQEPQTVFNVAMVCGYVVGIVYAIVLSGIICIKKSFGLGWYSLVVLSALLAGFGGILIGLIPAAYLTTRPFVRNTYLHSSVS